MANRFKKHYTLEEARALLPQIRQWLSELSSLTAQYREADSQLAAFLAQADAIGGEPVNRWVRLGVRIRELLREFERRAIQIKDLERGLLDFPAFIGGHEVFLCWEKDEEDIEHWHDLASGYEGREKLEP